MKTINNYIIEKFKISKNISISKKSIVEEIKEIINDVLKENFGLENTENKTVFRTYISNDNGKIVNDINEGTRISLYLAKDNKSNFKLYEKIAKELNSSLKDYIKKDIEIEENDIINGTYKLKIYFKK